MKEQGMKRVTAAILIKGGKILIARRRTGDLPAHKWEFPGGKVEEGETSEECLKREMKEEFRIEVKVGGYLGESVYHYKHGAIRLLAYRTWWESGDLSPMVHDEIRWVSPDQLEEYDFAPADVPFVKKLTSKDRHSWIEQHHPTDASS